VRYVSRTSFLNEVADWREVEAFVRRSYRLVAPRRLAKHVA
jgi:hypothetical protein